MGIDKIISAQQGPVADPNLLIRGGGGGRGGGHPDPEIGAGPGLEKTFFRAFGPQCDLKRREGAGALSWISHCGRQFQYYLRSKNTALQTKRNNERGEPLLSKQGQSLLPSVILLRK